MSFALTTGSQGTVATAEVVWSVDGQTYKFRSDNNFISWISTIFTVADVLASASTPDYRLLRATPATSISGTNIGAGSSANAGITTGVSNCAFGVSANQLNQIGSDNCAFGFNALKGSSASASSFNCAFGTNALASINNTNNNSAFGYRALASLGTQLNCSAFGSEALANATGSSNCAFGYYALRGTFGVSVGTDNTALGTQAGSGMVGGARNTLVGVNAGILLTTANNNTFIGHNAGEGITSGASNTAVGQDALGSASGATKTGNTCIGFQAGNGLGVSGSNNTIVGSDADTDTASRADCVILGRSAGASAVGFLDGSLAIGNAMANLVSGSATGSSGQHLVIYLNNTQYKIQLLNP